MQAGEPWLPYVVQQHTGYGPDHYDLMLQQGEALWTWRLDQPPGSQPGPLNARRIADHRLAYLTYEGPIGGGKGGEGGEGSRGRCRIVDRGRFRMRSLEDGRLALELAGGDLAGVFELRRVNEAEDLWQLRRSQ